MIQLIVRLIDNVLIAFFSQLLGVLILGLSAYLWWDSQIYLDTNELSEFYITPFVVLFILGAIMTVVGFLGCCGAIRESRCLLAMVKRTSISPLVHILSSSTFYFAWPCALPVAHSSTGPLIMKTW